jgi:hypothetical protein
MIVYWCMAPAGLALHKDIKTDCSVNAAVSGKTYCFGNEQAKMDFMKVQAGTSLRRRSSFSPTRSDNIHS